MSKAKSLLLTALTLLTACSVNNPVDKTKISEVISQNETYTYKYVSRNFPGQNTKYRLGFEGNSMKTLSLRITATHDDIVPLNAVLTEFLEKTGVKIKTIEEGDVSSINIEVDVTSVDSRILEGLMVSKVGTLDEMMAEFKKLEFEEISEEEFYSQSKLEPVNK